METKKKSDKHHVVNKVRKLFLYCIGKSPDALFIGEIEDEVEKESPGARQNYVYEIEKRLHPDSDYIPSDLLFGEGDFLTKQSGEYSLDTKRFNEKAKFWNVFFKIDHDNNYCEKTKTVEIPVKDQIKGVKVSDDKGNYIRLEVKFSNLIKNKKLNEGDVEIFTKSSLFENENKPYLKKGIERGRLVIRTYDIYFDIRSRHYVDTVSINPKIKYVLNLSGLLYFVSLCSIYNKRDINMIKEVIQNVSDQDDYISLKEEIVSKFGSVRIERIRDDIGHNGKESPDSNTKNRIKKRYPFLSYYNKYRNGFGPRDEGFIINFLFDAAKEFKEQLETLSISDLKYEATKRYLQRIRNYFYDNSHSRLAHISMSDEAFYAITNFQNEAGFYIEAVKKADYELESKKRESFKQIEATLEFERKFNKTIKTYGDIISIKPILRKQYNDILILNSSELKVIEKFCKYPKKRIKKKKLEKTIKTKKKIKNGFERYAFFNHLLIKSDLLEDIEKKTRKSGPSNSLSKELKVNKIPLELINNIENWIMDYRDPSSNQNWVY